MLYSENITNKIIKHLFPIMALYLTKNSNLGQSLYKVCTHSKITNIEEDSNTNNTSSILFCC